MSIEERKRSKWDGIERRADIPDDVLTKSEFEQRLLAFKESSAEILEIKLTTMEDRIMTKLDSIDKSMKEAFPNGDRQAHLEFHEKKNKSMRFWDAIIEKVTGTTAAAVAWAILTIIAYSLFDYIKSHLTK